jgi:hypothetical protein
MPFDSTPRSVATGTRLLAAIVEQSVLAFMWFGLPTAPLWMALIAGSSAPLRNWGAAMRKAAAHTAELRAVGVLRRTVEQGMDAAAAAGWRIEGACTHCGRCCVNGKCVFVSFDAQGQSSCAIHGRWFFRRLSCGAYPISARDIEAYACPSFRAVAPGQPTRRVIPIASFPPR